MSPRRPSQLMALLTVFPWLKQRSLRNARMPDQIVTAEELALAPVGSLGHDAWGRAVEKDAGGWYEPGAGNHMCDPLYVLPALPMTLRFVAVPQVPLKASPDQQLETV